MRLDVSLQQKQQMQLKLAPQMIQAIEILQLPNIDLKDRIDLELAENEVLEVDEQAPTVGEGGPPQGDGAAAVAAEEPGSGIDAGVDEEFSATIERLTSMAEEDRELGSRPSRAARQEATDRKFEALQATPAPPPSVQDTLAEQLTLAEAPEGILVIARAVIYSLDADGRLPIHPLARPILAVVDAEGNLTAPLEEVVEGLSGGGAGEGGAAGGGGGDAPAEEPVPYGSFGGYGSWGSAAAVRSRRARPSPRAAAQREARRRDRDEAREETRREAARVARSAGSLRRRMEREGEPFDLDAAVLDFPLGEILDLLEGEGVEATLADARRALAAVQSLEPRGIAGRTDEETLLLQVRPGDPLRERKVRLVTGHLEDWKKNRLPRICQAMGLSMDELKELLEEMGDLDPRPGARLRSERSPYLNPDVIIEWDDGEWGDEAGSRHGGNGAPGAEGSLGYRVRLVNEYFPTLRISHQYLRMFEDGGTDPAVREMLKKKIGSARWLIDAIRQRQDTLLRVVREIVRHQRDFLDFGLTAMRPLKMQRIADDLGIHVSTVSRAIADKYAQTPQGILPLKFFFHGGTESADGTVESRLTVKDRVRQAIEEEDRTSPLSDEDLAKKLKAEGLSIARRTVTKYRKQLGIPSSRERREWA